MSGITRATAVTLGVLALFPTSANAADYTVKRDGSGNFTTIQACVNAAQPGDTCEVYPGTYNEYPQSVRAGTASQPIMIRAKYFATLASTTTDLRATFEGFRFRHAYLTVKGMDMTGYTGVNLAYMRVEPAGDNCTIENNVFRDGVYLSSETFAFDAATRTLTNAAGGFIAAGFKVGTSTYFASFADPSNRPNNHDNNVNDGSASTWALDSRVVASVTDTVLTFTAAADLWTESGVIGTIYANSAEKAGVPAIQQINSSATGTPDNCTIRSNTFRNLAGRVIHLNGNNGTVEHNTFTRLGGWRLIGMHGNNNVFRYNTWTDSPRWPNFVLPTTEIAAQGGGTWDMYDAIFESQQQAGGDPTHDNVIEYNFINNVDTQFSNITSLTALGQATGLIIRFNVFANFEMGGSVTRPDTLFTHNTFYKAGYISAHPMNLGYSTIGPSDPNPTNLTNNAFVESGDMTCASRKGPTCVGTASAAAKAERGWYNLDDGRTIGYQYTPGITANYNFVAGSAADGYPAKTVALFVRDGQEANGVNGGDPRFQNVNNPLGPDGIAFTLDDGLKPRPGSPLCGKGERGLDIGAYSCDPLKVFSDVNPGPAPPKNLRIISAAP